MDRNDQDTITFHTTEGEQYQLTHYSDCCEHVYIAEIDGEVADLVGSGNPILQAEESSSNEQYNGRPEDPDSFTWTFYRISTAKGLVVLRWCGESNGYYSERVDFIQLK